MVSEEQEMSNGWPLGLENMNTRLRVMENLQASTAQPYSIHLPSTSFSSFSSSNLDTLSTTSFFQDNSVSLGRLIGIRPGDRGALYFPNKIRYGEHQKMSCLRGECSDMVDRGRELETPHRICLPQLLSVLCKMSRSRNNSTLNPNDEANRHPY